jgi:cobalt/nickel transport system ATP-binding protein
MTRTAIEIKNLGYSYPDGTTALEDIGLEIGVNERVGIIGPNGAGKSTLLLHLNGILRGKGIIRIFGIEVSDGNVKQIRRKIGLLFQDPDNQLFMPTVFDDVSFGPVNLGYDRQEVIKATIEALEEVNMRSVQDRMSHHLSFGEKKKISLATILSMSPEIMALDEPTSNLDPKSRAELLEILKRLPKTILIASHDLDFIAEVCERVIVLAAGRVVKDGPAAAILSDSDILRTYNLVA